MGKREKLLVTSTFSHSVFKRHVSQGRQKVSLCGNGLIIDQKYPVRVLNCLAQRHQQERPGGFTLSHTFPTFNDPEKDPF